MSKQHLYYKHSGKFNLPNVFIAIIVGILLSAVLGGIYGYLSSIIPFVFLKILAPLACGFVAGIITAVLSSFAKNRNAAINVVMVLLFGFTVWYTSWTGWLYSVTDHNEIVLNPNTLLDYLHLVSIEGAWSFEDTTPTGVFLYMFWAMEVLCIIGLMWFTSWGSFKESAYCEKTDQWMEDKITIEPLSVVANKQQLVSELENKNFEGLYTLEIIEEITEPAFTRLEITTCENNNESDVLLTLSEVILVADKEDEIKEESTTFLDRLIISQDESAIIMEQWKALIGDNEADDAIVKENV